MIARASGRAAALRRTHRRWASGPAILQLFRDAVVDCRGFIRDETREVLHLVDRTDFDLARAEHRVGAALHPFDGFGHVLDLPKPVARDQLAGFGERAVDHGAAWTVERDALAERG